MLAPVSPTAPSANSLSLKSCVYRPAPPITWTWITQIGPDTGDFLHRLTTVNIKTLGVGTGQPGFFLTAQGKVRAYFRLWRFGAEEFAFELDAGPAQEWKKSLLEVIDQFTFAEKFALADVSQGGALECAWIFPLESELAGLSGNESMTVGHTLAPGETRAIQDEIRLCHQGSEDFGRPWITAWGRPARLAQWLDHKLSHASPVAWQELERWRISAASPRPGTEITPEAMPLEIGLRRGISESKGCYPGQEVIEKIISLGSPARRLIQITGDGAPPESGSKIFNLADPPLELGEVTSTTAAKDGGFVALGIVKKIHAKEGLHVRFGVRLDPASTQSGQITAVSPAEG